MLLAPNDHQGGPAALTQCPVCHCEAKSVVCEIQSFVLQRCGECGCKYVTNPPGKAYLESYYNRPEWFNGGEPGGYNNYDQQTVSSLQMVQKIFDGIHGENLSVLDVGCGYGSHLKLAADKGWRCFGVEPSDHARRIAQERLGSRAMIVKSMADLIPHCFDLVLLLDVIEHVSNPDDLFYPIFNIGGIQEKTRIFLTTPNAGSRSAESSPKEWPYFHPPSHLTFYPPSSLQKLLTKLRFTHIDIQGIHPSANADSSSLNLENYEGLIVEASGSDFLRFMQERYVPATCSEITEYEHLPRYRYAQSLARNRTVMDFGCGTGYGTSILADVAATALGVDIDESALEWARETHRKPNLQFSRNTDFAASLPSHHFDLITCFEMIEHVSAQHQVQILDGFVHALKPEGVLLISTPNPEITALYGENPFHLCELSRQDFQTLLSSKFKHVQMIDQHALVGVFFTTEVGLGPSSLNTMRDSRFTISSALGYLALCSQQPLRGMDNHIYVDNDNPYIPLILQLRKEKTEARTKVYELESTVCEHQTLVREHQSMVREHQNMMREHQAIAQKHEEIAQGLNRAIRELRSQLDSLNQQHELLLQQPRGLKSSIVHKFKSFLR